MRGSRPGHSPGAVLSRDPSNPDLRAVIARIAAGEAVPPQIFWVNATDGTRRWFECVVSGMRGPDGVVTGVRGIARDVTARKRAEDALRASEERLRRLSRHHATIREEERKRLGFDLHDDVCQELIGIGILVESLRSHVPPDLPGLDGGLVRISRYVAEVGEHLRQLARDQRPMLLRDLGLEESLRSLTKGVESARTTVRIVCPIPIPRLDEDIEIGLYRIAQEALVNAQRHADAREVVVTLTVEQDTLRLEVRDDGCGFVPGERRGSGGLGLLSIEERALALGGRLAVSSRPGVGTTIRLEHPLVNRTPATAA